jgi:hypothetical protein
LIVAEIINAIVPAMKINGKATSQVKILVNEFFDNLVFAPARLPCFEHLFDDPLCITRKDAFA